MLRSFAPLLAIIVSIGIFFLYIKPMYDEISSIQDETTEYGEAVAKASEFNQLLSNLTSKRNSLTAGNLERLEIAVPDSIDPVRILVDIEAIAEQNRMVLGNVTVSGLDQTRGDTEGEFGTNIVAAISEDDFEKSSITFNVVGTYDRFKAFLANLEQSLTLFEVSELSFTESEGDLMEISMTIDMYALTPFNQ